MVFDEVLGGEEAYKVPSVSWTKAMMNIAFAIPRTTALLQVSKCSMLVMTEGPAAVQVSAAKNGDEVETNASLELEAPDQRYW